MLDGRGVLQDQDLCGADLDGLIRRDDGGRSDCLAVEERAIGTAEVFQQQRGIFAHGQPRVLRSNLWRLDADVTGFRAP